MVLCPCRLPKGAFAAIYARQAQIQQVTHHKAGFKKVMSMQLKLAAAIAAFSTRSSAALSTVPSSTTASPIVKNVAVPGLKNGMDYVKVGACNSSSEDLKFTQ